MLKIEVIKFEPQDIVTASTPEVENDRPAVVN